MSWQANGGNQTPNMSAAAFIFFLPKLMRNWFSLSRGKEHEMSLERKSNETFFFFFITPRLTFISLNARSDNVLSCSEEKKDVALPRMAPRRKKMSALKQVEQKVLITFWRSSRFTSYDNGRERARLWQSTRDYACMCAHIFLWSNS